MPYGIEQYYNTGNSLSESVNNGMTGQLSVQSSSSSFEESESIKLIEPYNPTDPIVIFDPTGEKSELARIYLGEKTNEAVDGVGDKIEENPLKIDGVKIPIIQLNNTAIDAHNIEEFNLKLVNFLPEIELKIYDYDRMIRSSDIPGMSNTITVILIAPTEGTSKKISLEFYVTECISNKDNTIDYKGIFNISSFRSIKNCQIGSGKLTTYELLEQIAKDNSLGFAATDGCKDINDKRYRQMYDETLSEFIEDQLSFAGTGSDTVIDAWIDEFGYLVMVNFAWVMQTKIDPAQLTIKVTKGINSGSKQSEDFENKVEDTIRMISNDLSRENEDNLVFSTYTDKVDNNEALKGGTNTKYYYLTDPGDSNTIQTSDGSIIEPSMDGANAARTYYTEKAEFVGINFTDDDDEENTPMIVQQKNISNYRASMCNKMIVVEMPKANYLLQRGTLVVVDINETSDAAKEMVIDESNAVAKTGPETESLTEEDINTEESELARRQMLWNDNKMGMQNIAVSGIYYIKDICFKYSNGDGEIKQVMTLVKKGLKTNLKNYMLPRKEHAIK